MYQLNNPELKESVERIEAAKSSDPMKDANLLAALIEGVVNSGDDKAKTLAKVERALMGRMKMLQAAQKQQLEAGQLMARESALYVIQSVTNLLMDLVKENVPNSTLYYIADSLTIRLYDLCKEDTTLRGLLYTDESFQQAASQFEGEPRRMLLEKLQDDRERNQQDEARLLK